MNKSERARQIEASPLSPLQITVPGDDTTPAGHRYASTYGNDFRQECAWSEKHELQLLHLMATAKPLREVVPAKPGVKLSYRVAAMVPAETVAVFLQSVPKADAEADDKALYFLDDTGYFNVVTDDGRQRRLDACVGNDRLRWIADTFVKPLWSEEKDVAERAKKLRERLYAYGGVAVDEDDRPVAATYTKAADPRTLPPLASGGRYEVGEVLAPWLSRAYVETLLRQAWFDDDGDAYILSLRVDVRGEDVDLADSEVLLNNIRGKEASVPTPLAVKAKQYQALLSAVDAETGEFKYTPYTLAQELKVSPDGVRNVTFYCEIIGEVRDAIDAGQVALKLAVTGRECICYGFNDEGERSLLSRMQQKQIWDALLTAFAVEAGSEAGIADNRYTRATLKKIKSEVLAGTTYEGGGKARKGGASVAASKAAAERAGVDTSALDDMSKPLSRVAKEDSEREDAGEDSHDTTPPAKKRASKPDNYSTSTPKKQPLNIRAALAVKATQLKMQLDHFDAHERDADEDGLVLAVADAVMAVSEGADVAATLKRFPVLLEALLVREVSKTAPSSPFAKDDKVRDIVARAVEMAAAAVGEGTLTKALVQSRVNEAAEAEMADCPAEIVVAASAMLDAASVDFDDKPLAATLENHIREYLYPA